MNNQSPEPSLVPLEQLGIRTNSGIKAATVRIIGGLSFARLGETGIVLVIRGFFAITEDRSLRSITARNLPRVAST